MVGKAHIIFGKPIRKDDRVYHLSRAENIDVLDEAKYKYYENDKELREVVARFTKQKDEQNERKRRKELENMNRSG